MLAGTHGALVELPQLGALALRVPLPERVAEGQHALLGPSLVLVAPGTAEGGVEPVGIDRVKQRGRLEAIARRVGARVGHPALIDGVLDLRHEQPCSLGLHLGVPVGEHLGEVVAGVHVEHGEGEAARPEGLGGQVQQHGGVLAAAEEQHRALRFGGHLADDEDGKGLEQMEVPQGVLHGPDQGGDRCGGTPGGGPGQGPVTSSSECGSGVHSGPLQNMTSLVMYTKACIRAGVKGRVAAPQRVDRRGRKVRSGWPGST